MDLLTDNQPKHIYPTYFNSLASTRKQNEIYPRNIHYSRQTNDFIH